MTPWGALFDANGFAPHGSCLLWDPELVALNLVANVSVAIACIAIPVQLALALLLNRTGEVRLPRCAIILLCLSMLLCGASHLFVGITLFHPLYWLQAGAVVLTALVSLMTAALLPIELIRSHQRGRDVGV